MHVVATAGHVDHGKSTLVRALTGMEPDRWAEEHRRGMTIDLGYAWTQLPSGVELAFVDVPGHQRFIGNMLAGLGPAPAVLFVVAADEGWSRQSEEHLAAARALDVRHAVLAVTRSDLADPEPTGRDAAARLSAAGLPPLATVAVSAPTGTGLDALRAALDRLVAALPPPDPSARVRLWIDRSFTIRGSGTVVTGTLAAGTIRTGDELDLDGVTVGVRGLQALGRPADSVTGTARVAVNLRGLARDAVGRGDALLSPGAWRRTDTLDVRLDRDERLPAELVLHVGTAAVPVRVRPLAAGLARLALSRPLPVQAGDRGVLRDPGRQVVAAGAVVLDADPPPLVRRGAAARRAAELAAAQARPDAAVELSRRGAVRRSELSALGVAAEDTGGAVVHGDWLVAPGTWQSWTQAVAPALADWAHGHPLQPAMPLPALRRVLGLPDESLLAPLLSAAGVPVTDGRAGSAAPSLGPAEAAVRTIEERLATNPFAAPERDELAALRLGPRELAAAERAGRLLRVSDDVVLLPDALERARTALRGLPQPFTTSQARQALGTTRRVAIPLLERLDADGVTERVDGQQRRLR